MSVKDVTSLVEVGSIDDELIPITKCVCGATFKNWGGFVISIYEDMPYRCPKCGRGLYFSIELHVYEVGIGCNGNGT